MGSNPLLSRIARKHVNLVDAVREEQRTERPRFVIIERVDTPSVPTMSSTTAAWDDWNDLRLRDLVKSGLLGE